MAEQLANLEKNGVGEPVKSYSYTFNGLTCNFYKKGDIKIFSITSGSPTSSIANAGVVTTIPSEYMPSSTDLSMLFLDTVTSQRFRLSGNGNITNDGGVMAAGTPLRTSVTYF